MRFRFVKQKCLDICFLSPVSYLLIVTVKATSLQTQHPEVRTGTTKPPGMFGVIGS